MKSRNVGRVFVALGLFCGICDLPSASSTASGRSAQPEIKDLADELNSRQVILESTSGNGSSSGSCITGELINAASVEKRIDVYLARPLYLVNRGSRQNMIAAQVYLMSGVYNALGQRSFITLRPKSRTPVQFVAFCADFDKDNPQTSDSFFVGSTPPSLARVMANINRFAKANPSGDLTCAAQVAIWLSQGNSIKEIRSKFDFTAADEALARVFLR